MRVENVEAGADARVSKAPVVFEYTNFRIFLKESFEYLKSQNTRLTESSFIQRAGLGSNSRGYLNLVVQGKRNLSSKTVLGFASALKLGNTELKYFDNLVQFNQAKTPEEKQLYFSKLAKIIRLKKTRGFEILESHYNYYKNWYTVVIRELVDTQEFQEDYEWIASRLLKRISKFQVKEAIDNLLVLGLLARNEDGKLIQHHKTINFSDNENNYVIVNEFFKQMLELAIDFIKKPYDERSISCVTLSCNKNLLNKMRDDINDFRSSFLQKYGTNDEGNNSVLQLSIQLFPLTLNENTSEVLNEKC